MKIYRSKEKNGFYYLMNYADSVEINGRHGYKSIEEMLESIEKYGCLVKPTTVEWYRKRDNINPDGYEFICELDVTRPLVDQVPEFLV